MSNPPGRPCKLNDETQRLIVEALRQGATHRMAAEYAGVGVTTFQTWLASPGDRFQALRDAVKAAEAKGDVGALSVIQQAAANGTWQAAAWLLERRHPGEYGRRQVLAVQRAVEPDEAELAAAAARGVQAADAAVLWRRQLEVLEHAYRTGQIDAVTYLERMDRLNAQATRLAELAVRSGAAAQGAPDVRLSLTLGSPAIDDPAPLPAGLAVGAKAPAGGDLIDVG